MNSEESNIYTTDSVCEISDWVSVLAHIGPILAVSGILVISLIGALLLDMYLGSGMVSMD